MPTGRVFMSRVRTVVATEILMLLGLLGFVGAAYVLERVFGLDHPVVLQPLTAVVLAAVPGLLWLGYFYTQDRHEPEPKHFVFGVYLLGVFLAGPVSDFLVGQVVPPQTVQAHSFNPFGADRLIYAFLLVGLAQELCKYAVVRYTMYTSPEFDEPLDGIVYMTAAGIGFATYQNYQFLKGVQGEVFLSTGAATAVVTTLAHACFAGVLGYTLGRAKFATPTAFKRSITLLVGLLCAAALNGQFAVIEGVVTNGGLESRHWHGVAYTFGFAAMVFFVLSLMMRRLLAISPHRPDVEAAS
jgi:RsiW-degrading membrane proteinase PrsW (M82 family)